MHIEIKIVDSGLTGKKLLVMQVRKSKTKSQSYPLHATFWMIVYQLNNSLKLILINISLKHYPLFEQDFLKNVSTKLVKKKRTDAQNKQ